MTTADVAGIAAHSAARPALEARGEAELARGAANLATVAALTLAATPAADGAALASSAAVLAEFVATVEPERRCFVAAMLDAALSAQVASRVDAGLPPLDRRIDGWMATVAAAAGGSPEAEAHGLVAIPALTLARYAAAAHAEDLDAVLLAAMPAVRALAEAARRGSGLARHLDAVQTQALALCARPAATAAEAAEARPTTAILERTLRRRRPLAAAVLAAKLRRDGG